MKIIRNLALATIFIIGLVYTTGFFINSTIPEKEDKEFHKEFNNNYAIYAVSLPENLEFAGEKVPLEFIDIRESLDREILVNTYWQSQTMLFLKRSNKFFPIIEPILKKNNIPDDFKYLAVAESGLQNVVSPAGARGYWQFLNSTGKDYGLEINNEVDERYSIEKSTEAACKYLQESYKKYKNWTLVAASYNVGMRGLDKQLVRQKESNYYNLLLNNETARYLFRILAIKTILSQPKEFGFHYRAKDLYYPIRYNNITVDTSITDWADFAKTHNTNYKILKLLNPWLRDVKLTNSSGKKYQIKIPKENGRMFILPDSVLTDSLKSNQ
ncbi:MAG: murein transglycosylase [Marinilabiliales bacterium]|nr:MAG: murein transglycosylase [Marinilabiliales bacterium]